jgi:salicylate hydroxylase
MYKDIEEKLAAKNNLPFTQRYTKGLPFGLKLSNGIIVGE